MAILNNHLHNARELLATAVLPDKAASGFIRAALDGSGTRSKLGEAWKGLKQDVFEVKPNLVNGLRELAKGLQRNP